MSRIRLTETALDRPALPETPAPAPAPEPVPSKAKPAKKVQAPVATDDPKEESR